MKQDAELKDGGKVSKDHPHYKFLKDLEDWQEKRNKSRRGKKVDLDPGRKADKAIRAKKGSIEPMKFQTGDLVEKEIKSKEGKLALDLQNPNSKLSKLIKKAQQGRLDKADLEAAKELGYKPSMSKKIGTGVDYNPLSGLVKWVKGLTSPKKKVDAKALLKKKQAEKDFKQKAGDKEVLSKFRKDLAREKKAGGGHGRETGLKIKQRKKEEYEHLAGLDREKSRQQKSDDKLAKGIAEKALKASKLRRGIGKGSKQKAGKRVDLLATDKTKKLINQHGPDFAKKVKKHMTDLEPLARSEKIGKETHSPEKIKLMKKH
jgi:hypothetical protein